MNKRQSQALETRDTSIYRLQINHGLVRRSPQGWAREWIAGGVGVEAELNARVSPLVQARPSNTAGRSNRATTCDLQVQALPDESVLDRQIE